MELDYWETHVICLSSEDLRALEPGGSPLTVTGLWFTSQEYQDYNDDIWYTDAQVSVRLDENEDICIVAAPVTPSGVGYRIL